MPRLPKPKSFNQKPTTVKTTGKGKPSTCGTQEPQTPAPINPRQIRMTKVTPRNDRQFALLDSIDNNDVTFGEGPAGTGKTFIAAYGAMCALIEGQVRRIVLSRPAVEAGEKLGSLPGNMDEKVDPYLRPLVDSIKKLIGPATYNQLKAQGIIEIIPVAFLRGLDLEDCFLLLDEAQNVTPDQMKMVLTRLGEGSAAVVLSDPEQIDLRPKTNSSIWDSTRFERVEGIGFIRFLPQDIVRSAACRLIVKRYSMPFQPRSAS